MKLVEIVPSTRKDKKLMAVFEYEDGTSDKIHFGAKGFDDFISHGDYKKRLSYIHRHFPRENWNEPDNPGALSRFILWGPTRSVEENITKFRERFGV